METPVPEHGMSQVFRVRNIPAQADDRQAVVELLCQSIKGITAGDVVVSSLADEVDAVRSSTQLAKTATIVFLENPQIVDILLSSSNGSIPSLWQGWPGLFSSTATFEA